jgi:hypothetical protein
MAAINNKCNPENCQYSKDCMRPANRGLETHVLNGEQRVFLEQYNGKSVNIKTIGEAYYLCSCLRTYIAIVLT